MKSVEESGLSFGISRLLACAEQNGLAAAVANCHSSNLQFTNSTHHNLPLNSTTNHLSLFQQAHNSLNQSTENENNCLIKSSLNGDKFNNENTLNLINSFTHYSNLANLTNHTNKNFLTNGLKPSLDSSLKGTTLLNALASNQTNNSRNSPKIILNSSGLNSSSNSLSTSINNMNPVSNANQSFLTNSANSSCTNNLTPPLVAPTLDLANASTNLNVTSAGCNALPCIPPRRIGHPYQNRTPPKRKKPRTSFNRHQIHELEKRFQRQKYLASTERANLAKELTMSDAQVKTWFQNRRTKWRQNEEERVAERQAANRLLFSLQNNTDHSGKTLNNHNAAFAAAAAAAAVAQHHSSNLFNASNQNHLTHPMNLLNNCSTSNNTNANQLSLPHHLLSPKSTTSNSSTSRDQLVHENELNDLKNQSNQNMHQHLNQLIHHQHHLLSTSNSHLLSNNSNSIQSLSDPSNHFSNNLNQHSLTSNLNNGNTNPIRTSSSMNDFHHQNSSMAAAVAALNSPGHLFNRSLNQISHLHQLGASIANNYSLSLANGQSPMNPLNQSLISQMSSNGQLKSPDCSSPSSTALASTTSTGTSNNTTAAQLYNMNQLSQLSHFAQLGFLSCNPSTLNALKFNNNINNQSNLVDQLRNEKLNEKNSEENITKKEWHEEKNLKNPSLSTNNEDLTDNESISNEEDKNQSNNFENDIDQNDFEEDNEEEIDMSETIDNNEIKKKKFDSITGKLYSIKNSDILSEENKRKKLLIKPEKLDKKTNKKKINKKMNIKSSSQIKENDIENFYAKSEDEESIDIEESDEEIEIKKQKNLNDPKIDELINKEERKKLKIKAYKLITSNSSIIGSA